eukprot:1300184-Pyramimonas_sp.AAC.1
MAVFSGKNSRKSSGESAIDALEKSPLSCRSSNVLPGCSATQREVHALAGRPDAMPKFSLAMWCHSCNWVANGG